MPEDTPARQLLEEADSDAFARVRTDRLNLRPGFQKVWNHSFFDECHHHLIPKVLYAGFLSQSTKIN